MNELYAAQASIPDFIVVERPEYAEHVVERMKQEGAIKVFDEIYKHGTPVVVETHLEEWRDFNSMSTKYALHYRLTAVRTRDVVMMPELPVFTFTNHMGRVEWKCPACSIINSIEATYCGEKHERAIGCGRPRDEVRK